MDAFKGSMVGAASRALAFVTSGDVVALGLLLSKICDRVGEIFFPVAFRACVVRATLDKKRPRLDHSQLH